MLNVALSWLSVGIVPVPLLPNSKRPSMPWKALQEHMPPPALVRKWFSEDSNLGLLCGSISGGLVVLDFDAPLHYHKWKREYPSLSQTYTVQTARGYHAYFYVDEPLDRTLSIKGGECKGNGYGVAPPSVHPSGWVYREVVEGASILSVGLLEELGIVLPVEEEVRIAFEDREQYSGSSLIDAIKDSLSMVAYLDGITNLKPSSADGVWLLANCPLHDDRNPSMWVNRDLNLCRCFKPGCPGNERPLDIINLWSKLENVSNVGAIQELAAELGL